MSAAATRLHRFAVGNVHMCTFSVAFTGTYATGGDTLDLSSVSMIGDGRPPIKGTIHIKGKGGFLYQFEEGTTAANGKIHVFTNSTGGTNSILTEHTNVEVVAGASADTINGVAFWGTRY